MLSVDLWPANVANGARPVALCLDVYRDVGSHAGTHLLGEYAVTSRRPLRQFRLAGVAAGLAVYAEALFLNSFDRSGPTSVSPAMNCSGVAVVVWCKRVVAFRVVAIR